MNLEDLTRRLAQTCQGEGTSLRNEAAAALELFLSDKDACPNGIQCLVEAIRVFAPEPPITDIPEAFRRISQQLVLHRDINQRQNVIDLFEKLDRVHGYRLFLQPDCNLDEFFSIVFQSFTLTPANKSPDPRLTRIVLKMMITFLNEADEIPAAILHRVFYHLTEFTPKDDVWRRKLAGTILRGLKERAVEQVCRFVQIEIFSEHQADKEISEDVFACLYEVCSINPKFIRGAMPKLAIELKRVDPVRRVIATNLVALICSLPCGQFLPEDFPQVWRGFLDRFDDVVDDVRRACTKHAFSLIQSHPDASSTVDVLQRCSARLEDKNKLVRLDMVSCIGRLALSDIPYEAVIACLPKLFCRCRDKEYAVGLAALQHCVDIYHHFQNDDSVSKLPAIVFGAYHLFQNDKRIGHADDCLDRLFTGCSPRSTACIFAFCAHSEGLDEVALNGLVAFSRRKATVRRLLLRLLSVRQKIDSREASIAVAQFCKFCPTKENAVLRFLAYNSNEFWECLEKWTNRSLISVLEAQTCWRNIELHCERMRPVAGQPLLRALRHSGAHLFVGKESMNEVLKYDSVLDILSRVSPYCFFSHLSDLARVTGEMGCWDVLTRVAKAAMDAGDALEILDSAYVDNVLSLIHTGEVNVVHVLCFASISDRQRAYKHILEWCLAPIRSNSPKRAKMDEDSIVNSLRLATAVCDCKCFPLADDTRDKFCELALTSNDEYSWNLLAELGCLTELVQLRKKDALPMIIHAMTKNVSVSPQQAIDIMAMMVSTNERLQLIGDIHRLLAKTNWKPTFTLVLMLSVFGMDEDKCHKVRRTEAHRLLTLLLLSIESHDVENLTIGFVVGLNQASALIRQKDTKLIATFFSTACISAKKDSLALAACRKATTKVGLALVANIVFDCMAHALEAEHDRTDNQDGMMENQDSE